MVTCLAVFEATSSASSVSRKSAYEASLAVASCRRASRRSRLLNSRSRCICSCKRSSWAALMASPPRRRAPRRWRDPGSRPRGGPAGRARSGARTRPGGRAGRWRPGRGRAGCGAGACRPALRARPRGPRGEEIPLEVVHARFDLAFGLRPVGSTEVGLEAPIVGELLEGRIPDDPPLAGGVADRPRPIVQMLARVTAEILESPFMGVEELAERLPQARLVKAAPRGAERHEGHVQDDRLGPEVDPGPAPIDLA